MVLFHNDIGIQGVESGEGVKHTYKQNHRVLLGCLEILSDLITFGLGITLISPFICWTSMYVLILVGRIWTRQWAYSQETRCSLCTPVVNYIGSTKNCSGYHNSLPTAHPCALASWQHCFTVSIFLSWFLGLQTLASGGWCQWCQIKLWSWFYRSHFFILFSETRHLLRTVA